MKCHLLEHLLQGPPKMSCLLCLSFYGKPPKGAPTLRKASIGRATIYKSYDIEQLRSIKGRIYISDKFKEAIGEKSLNCEKLKPRKSSESKSDLYKIFRTCQIPLCWECCQRMFDLNFLHNGTDRISGVLYVIRVYFLVFCSL